MMPAYEAPPAAEVPARAWAVAVVPPTSSASSGMKPAIRAMSSWVGRVAPVYLHYEVRWAVWGEHDESQRPGGANVGAMI
jgi:hypothetical protein